MSGSLGASLDVRVFADAEVTVSAISERLTSEIRLATDRMGRCRLALAGGSTPRRLYERLAQPEARDKIPWHALEIFFGDERCVAPDDPQSNYQMARETLVDRVPLRAELVHPMDGLAPPEEAALAYARRLGPEPLDVVLLGLGDDGHTASLFPGDPGLLAERRAVVATVSPLPPHNRVSLSLRTLRAACLVLFLVTGPSKAKIFAKVAEEGAKARDLADVMPGALPAALAQPEDGSLTWYLDAAAASASPYSLAGATSTDVQDITSGRPL